MITEDFVSFETAQLLKEREFDEYCPLWYNLDKPTEGPFFYKEIGWYGHNSYDYNGKRIVSAPTIQMAMKWLREVYGLFIRITEDISGNVFEWSIYQKNYGCKVSTYVEDSYEQACETAIKYCLENLIK